MGKKSAFSFLDHLSFVEDDASSYAVEISENGFSYLDMLSEKKARKSGFEEKQRRATSAALDGSTRARGKSNVTKIESVNHDEVCFDTSLQAIIDDLQKRRQKTPAFPFAIAGFVICLFLVIQMPPVLAVFFGAITVCGGGVFLWNVKLWDKSRRNAKFSYRFSEAGGKAFEVLNNTLKKVASSQQVLVVLGKRHFDDTRYTGGASALPTFDTVRLCQDTPPLIEMNTSTWRLRLPHKDVYFMPDHMLVFDGGRIGGISYSNLKLSQSFETNQARDKAVRTRDCKVVGSTWRFVNNDGSPDKRFNNNVQIPLVEYGVLGLSAPGLDLALYTSLQEASTQAPRGFGQMQRLSGLPTVPTAAARRAPDANKTLSWDRFCALLMDALCCVMLADGKADDSERKRIVALMRRARAPWDEDRIVSRITSFIAQSREEGGFSALVASTVEKLGTVQDDVRKKALLNCLSAVARADGVVDDSERKILEQFHQLHGVARVHRAGQVGRGQKSGYRVFSGVLPGFPRGASFGAGE